MFITFEGIEGSGKTTQVKKVYEYFQRSGRDCVMTREPGGTAIGEQVRSILLDPKSRRLDSLAELFLYMADRAQHLKEKVRPWLSEGKIVLCDRYYDATLAYQGFARGLDIELISGIYQLAFGDFRPDITFLLDLPPQIGLNRAWRQIDNGQRTGTETRFEEEALSFHKKVREGYLSLAGSDPQRFRVVDASREEALVEKEIISALSSILIIGKSYGK